jgi:hypothetical protein
MGNGPSRVVEQQMARHRWIGTGAAHYGNGQQGTQDEQQQQQQQQQEDVQSGATSLPESLMLGNPADLHTFGSSWMAHNDYYGAIGGSDLPPAELDEPALTLLNEARRVIFQAAGPPANKSECAQRIADASQTAASSSSAAESHNSAVFRAWRAIDQNDGATLSQIVAHNRLPPRPIGTAIDQASVERRIRVIAELMRELSAEESLLSELRRCDDINPVVYAVDAGAMSCVDSLLDAGIGFSSRKKFNVELASMVRTCTPQQVARMLANGETNLLHLEESFIRTKQRGDGPFPFFPMRNVLEEAFAFDQKYRRNQLYFLIERYRAARARGALCAVAGADPAVVAFVECMCELPQLCRALVVQYAVQVPPPPPEPRRLIVVLDTVRVWIRSVVMNEQINENGERALFVTYENWDSRYDEWIPENSERLRPWVHPRLRAVAEALEFIPDEAIVKHWLKRCENKK